MRERGRKKKKEREIGRDRQGEKVECKTRFCVIYGLFPVGKKNSLPLWLKIWRNFGSKHLTSVRADH